MHISMSRRLILLFSLIFMASVVSAAEIMQQTVCHVEADEVVEGNLFVLCRDFRMNGRVRGHLIGASINAVIDGQVDKNVYLVSGDLRINGEINGDIHFAGGVLELTPEADIQESDVIAVALSSTVQENVEVDSFVGFGYQLLINGEVSGDVDYWGGAVRVRGSVDGNVNASVGNSQSVGAATQLETFLIPFPFSADLIDMGLYIPELAQISGDLSYVGYFPAEISGTVEGNISFRRVETGPTFEDLAERETRGGAVESYLQHVLREIITLGLIGFFLLFFVPETVQLPISVLRRKTISSLGIGILTFMLSFPIFLLIVLISLLVIFLLSLIQVDAVLFAIGILVGLVDIGGASIFYFIAIYISRIVTSVAIGRFLLYRFQDFHSRPQWFYSLLMGVGVMSFLSALPVLGWIINAFALLAGLGALVIVLQAQIRHFRDQVMHVSQTTSPVVATSSGALTPPILDDVANRPRGMDNLPDGFIWWRDDE